MATFDIILNPEDTEYYNKFYISAYNEKGWLKSFNDYSVWKTAFGEDYFFLLALDKKTKAHVGNIVGVFYRNNEGKRIMLGVGGFYLFPEFRGGGQGWRLFEALMDIAKKENVNVFLNCREEMKAKYIANGLNKLRDNHMICYKINYNHVNIDHVIIDHTFTIIDTKDFDDWEKVKQFDQTIIGNIDRSKYLKERFLEPTSHGSICLDNQTKQVTGFVNLIEVAGNNIFFGPMYADSDEIAELLFVNIFDKLLSSTIKINEIHFTIYKSNKCVVSLLNKYTNGQQIKGCEKTSHFSKFDIGVKTEFVYCFGDGISFT
uniref:N-acetyltransferase domain-containing protein n=1 Tax=Rhabditophanes sp. KR3021 TaxID=114890 RepID=A0AC35UCI0_9BILA